MDWLRWQQSPWGERIPIGLSWDVAWVALGAAAFVIVVHAALYQWRWRAAKGRAHGAARSARAAVERLPERLLRHTLASRIFHWAMAAMVSVLLLTVLLPIMGIKFPWVTLHWATGFALTGGVVFHVAHAALRKSLRSMWIGGEDLKRAWAMVRLTFDPRVALARAGKYPLENKLFHHAVALATLAAVVSGLVIMVNIDTPWWNRNPYLLSETAWGVVYVIHGVGAVALVMLIPVHLYFALRPEKLWITLSMFRGWISRERFLERHDPSLWPAAPPASGPAPSAAKAPARGAGGGGRA